MATIHHPSPIPPAVPAVTPEFIRLPARGGDVVFGRSRSWWYDLERRGLIRLTRLRKPGQVKGSVMVSVAAGRELHARLAESATA